MSSPPCQCLLTRANVVALNLLIAATTYSTCTRPKKRACARHRPHLKRTAENTSRINTRNTSQSVVVFVLLEIMLFIKSRLAQNDTGKRQSYSSTYSYPPLQPNPTLTSIAPCPKSPHAHTFATPRAHRPSARACLTFPRPWWGWRWPSCGPSPERWSPRRGGRCRLRAPRCTWWR